jgi:hypothetical protein
LLAFAQAPVALGPVQVDDDHRPAQVGVLGLLLPAPQWKSLNI